jgi:hypothetical protein
MKRRDAIKLLGGALGAARFHDVIAIPGLLGGAVSVGAQSPIGMNLGAGGSASFNFEDFPLTQDLVPWGREFDTVASPGVINSGTNVATDSSGWPTADWGQFLHVTSQSPSWMSGAFACGYISRGSGNETITGVNATVGSVVRNGTLVTFTLTPTGGTWGYTVTGGSGCTSVWAYLPAYASNAASLVSSVGNAHVDITVANVNAGRPLFTTDALNFYKQFQGLRWLWAQGMWNCMGSIQVAFATNPAAGATSGTLAANTLAPGTYQCFFTPTSTPPGTPTTATCADVRSITISSTGQTAISWTGGLNYGASAITLACSSAQMHTAANTKTQGLWKGGNTFTIEAYPAEWARAFAVAAGQGVYLALPINDDGTYFEQFITDCYNEIPPGVPVYFGLADEVWNGTGGASYCFNALALAAFPSLSGNYSQYAGQYLATRLNAIATAGKSICGSRWNTDFRLLMEWQEGATNVPGKALAYYVAQGWDPAADIWSPSVAPYLANPGLSTSDSIATIQSKVAAVAATSAATQGAEAYLALKCWYGLPSPGLVAYESGWDSKALGSSYTNIGAAIVDPGMTAPMTTYWQSCLDYGFTTLFNFEGGCCSSNATDSPLDEFHYDYSTLVSGSPMGSAVPRVAALQALMPGTYVPQRNVIAKSGDQVDWRYYLDSTTTANAYPTFSASSNISPINNFSIGMHVYVPEEATLTIESYFTTVAGSGSAGSVNFYVDGTEVASAVSIPLGLSGTSSAPVTLGTHTFTAGHHYIELGTGSYPGNITANMLQVQ